MAKMGMGSGLPETAPVVVEDLEANTSAVFSKAKLMKAARFSPIERDVLSEILEVDQTYTIDQVLSKLDEFSKGVAN